MVIAPKSKDQPVAPIVHNGVIGGRLKPPPEAPLKRESFIVALWPLGPENDPETAVTMAFGPAGKSSASAFVGLGVPAVPVSLISVMPPVPLRWISPVIGTAIAAVDSA